MTRLWSWLAALVRGWPETMTDHADIVPDNQAAGGLMRNCKTCVHWRADMPEGKWDEYMFPTDPDTYLPMEMPFEVRICEHPKKLFCERPVERDGFSLQDGSGYWATIYTAEGFGCVLHDPYPPQED